MSVEADKKRDEPLGSYEIHDTTQDNYSKSYTTKVSPPCTYTAGKVK